MMELELAGARVLIVDDTPANIDVLAAVLAPEGYSLSFATSGEQALKRALQLRPDLILLDVMLPGWDGFETCARLRAALGEPVVPVIFVTARDDTLDLVRGLQVGAVDYLTKPIQHEEVLARVRTHLRNGLLTRRYQALYQEHKEQAESLRVILNNISEAIFMLDGEGVFQMVNPAAERLLSVAPGALLGQTLIQRLEPDQAALFRDRFALWQQNKDAQSTINFGPQEVRLLADNGDYHAFDLSLCGMPVARPLYVGVMRDIEAHKRVTHELRRLARIDPLTQLANRRAFDEVLQREWGRAQEQGRYLALAMIDIDYFKAYNDHYGHQKGDQCLRQVALCIASVSTERDGLAARYGGEEFALILPGKTAAEAEPLVQKLRAALAQMQIAHAAVPPRMAGMSVAQEQTTDAPVGGNGLVTMSIGLAALIPGPGHALHDFIESADQALYRAKAEGRDRIVVAGASAGDG